MKYEKEIREIIKKTLELGVDQFCVSTHDGSLSWGKGGRLPLSAGTVADICSEMVAVGLAKSGTVSALVVYYTLTPRAKDF